MTNTAFDIQTLPNVRGTYKFNEPLKNYTWLNVGGPADVMFFPKDTADLQYFLQNKPSDIEIFVLGGGANILVRDAGIGGVVVKLKDSSFCNITVNEDNIICGTGLLNNVLKKRISATNPHWTAFSPIFSRLISCIWRRKAMWTVPSTDRANSFRPISSEHIRCWKQRENITMRWTKKCERHL